MTTIMFLYLGANNKQTWHDFFSQDAFSVFEDMNIKLSMVNSVTEIICLPFYIIITRCHSTRV